ncbi:MAG: N-acetyltransferase family protein [Pseudomonadota bacterium]
MSREPPPEPRKRRAPSLPHPAADATVVRPVKLADVKAIAAIYNHYIETSFATFETKPVSIRAMTARIREVRDINLPWLVADRSGDIAGYAYATKWKERSAYRFSVESTVYLAPSATGGGVGTHLYAALLDELRALPVNAVLGGITLPNPASVALHEKLGMQKVAHLKKVGYKFDQWVDVGYWQICLDDTASDT